MKNFDLNCNHFQIKKGIITRKQAVHSIATFLLDNYRIFGLQKYDEDFRGDLILSFLEKGEHLFELFNPEYGEFFTFLYCFIISLSQTKMKTLARKTINEKCILAEAIKDLEEKENLYSSICYQTFETGKTPFRACSMNAKELRDAFSANTRSKQDKKILVLALKSSFYITDEQIKKICSLYKMNRELLYQMIQYCKASIDDKKVKHEKALQRRNSEYFLKNKCYCDLERLKSKEDESVYYIQEEKIKRKQNKHNKNLDLLNKNFKNGYLSLRPTTKTVADILGICERQVNYYISCARRNLETNK